MAPNKGTMVAMAQRPVTHVINYCRPPTDGDIIVPNGTGVVLGTTASPAADPDDTGVPAGEQERLIAEAIRMVPVLREVATWNCLLLLERTDGPAPSSRSSVVPGR
ncbi:MAG: hypothetical protein KY433_05815 [Actinobacteria bacterium]|nr:hypothetical protein [Actinomycetota bacterium]